MLLPSLRRMGIGGIFALTMAGLTLQSCNPLMPRAKKESVSSVSVAFDPTVLGDLAAHMKTLQIRVFSVVNDQTSAQEGADIRLAIEAQKKDYTIENIALGLKEIEISILNESDLALGTGKVRILVKPGLNKTEPVVIKLKKIDNPVTSITLAFVIKGKIGDQDLAASVKRVDFSWKTETTAQNGISNLVRSTGETEAGGISFTEIKPILDSDCVKCHKEGNAKGKLKLDRFPFESGLIADSNELLKEIMNRIQDEDAPMPPAGLMEDGKINSFKSWEDNKFALANIPAGTNSFSTTLPDLRVSDKLSGVITLYGDNDIKLGEKEITPYVIEENGKVSQELEFSLAQPAVVIPVVVEVE